MVEVEWLAQVHRGAGPDCGRGGSERGAEVTAASHAVWERVLTLGEGADEGG